MARPRNPLLKKVSSLSAAAAGLLSSAASASAQNDPATARRVEEALDALKKVGSPDAGQVRFHMGGQLDRETEQILLAGHTSHVSHSSHVSGSYTRDPDSSYATPTPSSSYYPSYDTRGTSSGTSYATPSAAPTPDRTNYVRITLRDGTEMMGEVLSKTAAEIVVRNALGIVTHIQRAHLSAETITALNLPALVPAPTPASPVVAASPSALPVYQESAAVTPAPPPAPTPLVLPVQMVLKLTTGSKIMVTVLTRSLEEITFRTKDGHDYRLPNSRLSNESLVALQLPPRRSGARE